MSFLDPALTKDGKPYQIFRLKDIIQERYYISKHLNTSYIDTGNISLIERDSLLQLIYDDLQTRENEIKKLREQFK